ncbi:Quinone oxidoreductase-like protein 2 like protein [Cladophialophora carrionii]|uniref:Quinone oxidoreductase-like protein 2 like protein n=1 Tax=Cladophialophora carrionii TaxID=86049 RepID=A0A1C1CZ47_9EURO|nr:Quinone oxidoreductase-like protein 2 like protein [Cladophialophora carrionii]
MKAIHVTEYVQANSELRVTEIPPPVPGADKVLVNITHSALNHVDLLYARGKHQNNHIGLVKPPFVLGIEFAGTVASAPPGCPFKPGDHVWGAGVGGFAEQIAVPASALFRLPTGWTLHDAAGLGAGTAPVSYGAVIRTAGVKAGQTVLVHAAAGGLGVVAVQIAHAVGAQVIGTVGSEEKADVVRKLGVLGVVRYDSEGWEKEVLRLTNGVGVDSVYDTVGLVEKSIRCLKFGGNIVIAGFAGLGGKMETLAMNRVLLKGARLLGYRYGETGRRDPAENEEVWRWLNEMLASGKIKPVVYATYRGLESVPQALDDLASRKVWGKAVIEIQAPRAQLQAML